jgi:oligopeptide transport system permease protein
MYFTRNEVVTILNSDYILIARSKGLSEKTIFTKYVARNASLPILTILIPSFIMVFGGSFVIELFFDIPGTSSSIINAIKFGEINVVMFSTIFLSAMGTYTIIGVDILYVALDPRITYATATETK